MQWRKPTKRESADAAMEAKTKHYFYHCERDPAAFERLKVGNLRRHIIEATRKEAAEIQKSAGEKSSPDTNPASAPSNANA